MVQCVQCKQLNTADRTTCLHCKADLLPNSSKAERALTFAASLAASAFCAYFATRHLGRSPSILFNVAGLLLSLLAAAAPLAGIYTAVRGQPLYQRYARRARRHLEIDPQQAAADFESAIQAAPPSQKTRLSQERTALNGKLGLASEQRVHLNGAIRALNQSLAAASTEEKPALYKELAGLHAELGETAAENRALLAATYAAELLAAKKVATPDAVEGSEQVLAERQELIRQERIIPYGFCPACQCQVELTPDLLCPDHPQSKIKMLIYAAVKEPPGQR